MDLERHIAAALENNVEGRRSQVTCHTTHVTRHSSHATRHMSHATHYTCSKSSAAISVSADAEAVAKAAGETEMHLHLRDRYVLSIMEPVSSSQTFVPYNSVVMEPVQPKFEYIFAP